MHVLKQAGLFVRANLMDSPPGRPDCLGTVSLSGSRATAHPGDDHRP